MQIHSEGERLNDRYRIIRKVGGGGFGVVYRAIDEEQDNRDVAIKQLVLDKIQQTSHLQAKNLFLREAMILTKLDHPHLPRVSELFEYKDILYIVMDFIEGQHLDDYAGAKPDLRLSEAEALQVMLPVLDALSYLHSQKPPILHRDIKPSNIIRTNSGKIYVVDFGMAKITTRDTYNEGGRRAQPTAPFHSAGFSAPELYRQAADIPSDLYSFGATLYNLVTNKIPIPDQSITEPYLSTQMAQTLTRLLKSDPRNRFQNAKEVKQALDLKPRVQRKFLLFLMPPFMIIGIFFSSIIYHRLMSLSHHQHPLRLS
ncbi:serine/threonine protein kinase [bacterium]|nr:serine/threonine protein kinase [bacterium]